MEDVFDAAWQNRSTARNTTLEAELASLIDVYGLALLEESGQIRHSLTQAFPGERRNIAAILGALSAGVPERLRNADEQNQLAACLKECAQDLQEQGGLAADLAMWAVRAWTYALALPSQGVGGLAAAAPKGGAADRPSSQPQAPINSTAQPPAIAREDTSAASAPASRPTMPFGRMHTAASPPAKQAVPEEPRAAASPGAPLEESEPKSPPPVAAPTPPAPPIAAPTPPVADDTSASPDDFPRTAIVGHGGSTILVEPLFSDGDLERISRGMHVPRKPVAKQPARDEEPAVAPPVKDAAPVAAVEPEPMIEAQEPIAGPQEPLVAPSWERPVYERPGLFGRPLVIAVLLIGVAAVIGFFGLRLMNGPASTTVARDSTPSTAEAPAPTGNGSMPSPPTPNADQASSANQYQSASEDRSPAPKAETPSPAPTSAPTSPSQASTASTTPPPVAQETPAPAEAPANTPSSPEAAPAPSTAHEGPATAAHGPRPSIERIDVPRVIEGDPFTVALRLADARDVVSIERRIVESAGTWPRNGTIPLAGGQRRSSSNVVTIPFRAMDAPAHATIAFTAIARDGSRSEPKTVTITVAEPMSSAAPVSVATRCSPATCGTVVASREIVPDVGDSAIYRITVHMDDGETRTFTAPYRLQSGTRLQLVGDRFVSPADSR